VSFRDIKPGDRVWYSTPQGVTLCGRAQRLLCFDTHVVVDAGGGRPKVVNDTNFVQRGGPHPGARRAK
jgi:hypothetical protein